MASYPALAGLLVASAGVGLQWVRLLRGQDISEPLHLPPLVCGVCPPRFEASVPEHRLFLLDLIASPEIWLELFVVYLIGVHLVLGLFICKYGRRCCCGFPAGRRVGLRSRIGGAVPARHADIGDIRGRPGVSPRASIADASH